MRKQFCDALVLRAARPEMIFLTGDLGFMALEALQATMKDRFINAGIAEQNMISVAAAMARQGLEPWVYSIAPFCYARPFEQIRNDICFHGLPVKLVGNGGGYGYGVMGPTHHAIDDYGVLLTLPNMRAFIPVFDEDVAAVVELAGESRQAAYMRLGRGEPPVGFDIPAYSPWRKLVQGSGVPVVAVGPLAGTYIEAVGQLAPGDRPTLWALAELPLKLSAPPSELLDDIRQKGALVVAEEHVAHGGAASELSLWLMQQGIAARLSHLCAKRHHYSGYGSQRYLREQSGLLPSDLLNTLQAIKQI